MTVTFIERKVSIFCSGVWTCYLFGLLMPQAGCISLVSCVTAVYFVVFDLKSLDWLGAPARPNTAE